MELVGFEEDVRKAMEYTFGNVIICDTSDIAKEIAFDRKIRNRTVTLEGDSFDPSGIMTGGARNAIGSLLSRITDLSVAKDTLSTHLKELHEIEKILTKLDVQNLRVRDIENDLELKKHAFKMCEEKLADSSYAQIHNEITTLETTLVGLEQVGIILDISLQYDIPYNLFIEDDVIVNILYTSDSIFTQIFLIFLIVYGCL